MEKAASSSSPPSLSPWSGLPADLLTSIFRRLNTRFDLLRLRAVCSSWRSSLPLSHPPPFPLFLPPLNSSTFLFHPFSSFHLAVFDSTVFRISPLSCPSSSWLVKLSFSSNRNSLSLLNPLCTSEIKIEPPFSLNAINLLDYRISKIADSFHLKVISAETSFALTRKLVVLPDLTVLLLSYSGRLEKWRPGYERWTSISGNNDARDCYYYIDDVIRVGNQCYAVNASGNLLKFDSDFNFVELTTSLGYSTHEHKYLVPSSNGDDLYLVIKVSDPEPEFYYDSAEGLDVLNQDIGMRVFKLNWEQGNWDFVGRAGDQVFFLGNDVSFMVSASDFDGCRANSIYLTDACFENDDCVYGRDTGLYALDECFVSRLEKSPEYAKLFWPPPCWLMQGSGSSES